MKHLKSRYAFQAPSVIAMLLNATVAAAFGAALTIPTPSSADAFDLIDNGGLTGEIPPTNGGVIASVPPGWVAGYGNVDMHESGGTGYWDESWPASIGGTQFVAAVGLGLASFDEAGESFFQIVDGLKPGRAYKLTFYQANLGADSTSPMWQYESAGYWHVSFGSSSFDSPIMPFMGFGADGFTLVEVIFVADLDMIDGKQRLEFMAYDGDTPDDNNLAHIAIDDITLTQLTPEPTTMLLLSVGGLTMLRRR